MCEGVRTLADRRYVRRCQIGAGACLLLYVAGSQLVTRTPQGPLATALAVISGLGFFGELVCVGLLTLRKLDEFQRVLMIRSFLWATIVTMGLTTVWGYVELSARRSIPRLDFIWIPVLLLCVTAAAKLLIFRHHRADVD